MNAKTRQIWDKQNLHPGDRLRLFRAVLCYVDATAVLYPGSFVDVAPSFVFHHVTYLDTDRRAAAFFRDVSGVREIIHGQPGAPAEPDFRFLHVDYASDLGPAVQSFDLLIRERGRGIGYTRAAFGYLFRRVV